MDFTHKKLGLPQSVITQHADTSVLALASSATHIKIPLLYTTAGQSRVAEQMLEPVGF
jgi:hypothetical protein